MSLEDALRSRRDRGPELPADAAVVVAQRVVAVVRSRTRDEAGRAVGLLVGAGLTSVEVSLVTPGALDAVARAVDDARAGALVGVGTVLSPEDVAGAHAAGARFVVSPTLDGDVVRAALDRGLVPVPGVATPTEAVAAARAGAPLVKLFPASVWSPPRVADLLAALPGLALVPTGGVGLRDAPEWIRAGAVAVGVGSALTRGGEAEATRRVRTLLSGLRMARLDVLRAVTGTSS